MKIFICQTPFQLFYSKILMKYLYTVTSEKDVPCLIIHSNVNIINENWPPNVSFMEFDSNLDIFKGFAQLKKIIKKINSAIENNKNGKTRIFIPHIGGLLANYIYYLKKTKKIELNLYYEGILYFYEFEEKFQLIHLKRYFLALILGFKYKYTKRILPYESERIKSIYTPLKKFTKGPKERIIEVPLIFQESILEKEPNEERFLILGGPVDYITDFYDICLKEIVAKKISSPKIFYKGHASFNTHNFKFKNNFYEAAKSHKIDFKEISQQLAVETIIKDIAPTIVFSYYSSALINIQLMSSLKHKTKCYLGPKDKIFNQIKHIFEYYDIEIINIKY
tara:strand:+ start:31110 stop:32117 length:1008 start_codon:yes stop_codon:yes gene_type:complete